MSRARPPTASRGARALFSASLSLSLVGAIVSALAALASCGPPPPGTLACESHRDCAVGYRCDEEQRCVPADKSADAGERDEDGGTDAGSDSGPGDRDAGTDAGTDGGSDGGLSPDGGPGDDDAGTDAGSDGGLSPDGAPQLYAVHPSLAAVGDLVALEGRFPAGNYTVSFGDAAVFVAVPADASRLLVEVPAEGTSAGISVRAGDIETLSLPFRVTTFTPRVGAFARELEQTLSARSLSRTSRSLERTFAFTTEKHLHVVEERTSNGFVDAARIYADGTLGAFATRPGFPLPTRVLGRAFVRVGSWLYAIGGQRDGEVVKSIERAPISGDLLAGAFTPVGVTLTSPRMYASAVVVGRWLYVLGGRSTNANAEIMKSLERAPILAGGELGAFEAVDGELDDPRDLASAHVVQSWLYVVGGTSNNNTIERATIDSDGELGPFEKLSSLTSYVGRRAHGSVVLGDQICLIGGQTGSNPITNVQCARASSNPSLAFSNAGELTTPRAFHGVAVAGNRLLVIGGSNGNDTGLAPEWAPIDYGASILGIDALNTSAPGFDGMACAIVEDRFVITGGLAPMDDAPQAAVYSALLDADGRPSAFSRHAQDLVAPRGRHRLAIHGDKLWVVGGVQTESSAATPVESSNASWPLSFTAEAVTLEGGRSDYASFLAGETLYLLGGRPFEHATTASCFDFQSAGFVPCGGLLPTARTGAAGAVLGGSTWLFGGLRADNALLTEILSAPLSAAELSFLSSGSSEDAPTLNVPRQRALTTLLGGHLVVVGGQDALGNAILTSERLEVSLTGTLESPVVEPTTLPMDVTGGCIAVTHNRVHLVLPGAVGGTHYIGTLITP